MRSKRRYGYAALAPMPDDPLTCRWCERHMTPADDGSVRCEGGCAANDNPLYLGLCDTCGHDFETGYKWGTTQCWTCSQRALARLKADLGDSPKITGYTVDRTRRGANREANRLAESERAAHKARCSCGRFASVQMAGEWWCPTCQPRSEPPDPDGEVFRGGEAAAAQQDAQAEAWKVK